jgi:hypothetical protein
MKELIAGVGDFVTSGKAPQDQAAEGLARSE